MLLLFSVFFLPSDCVYIGWNGKRWWRHKDVSSYTCFYSLIRLKSTPYFMLRAISNIYLHTQEPKETLPNFFSNFLNDFSFCASLESWYENLCQIHNWFAISFICNINFKQQSRGGSLRRWRTYKENIVITEGSVYSVYYAVKKKQRDREQQ